MSIVCIIHTTSRGTDAEQRLGIKYRRFVTHSAVKRPSGVQSHATLLSCFVRHFLVTYVGNSSVGYLNPL